MGSIRVALVFTLLSSAIFAADNSGLTITSAASPQIGIAPDSLASIFGPNISTMTEVAPGPPWPTSLGDITTVNIVDSANQQTQAQILFISPSQMNIYIPPTVAPGPATIQFPTTGLPPGVGTAALRNISTTIQKTAPALFSARGTGEGVAAATAVRVVLPTQIQSPVTVFTCVPVDGCQPVPIDPGVDAPVYLSFYGTGIRGGKNISVTIGNMKLQPLYAGPQPQTPGLDQVHVQLPLSLHGAGLVTVTLTVDGQTSNPVQLDIQ